VPPAGNTASVSFKVPLPEAFGHTAPPLAEHAHAWLAIPAGIGSETIVPGAFTDPTLLATIV